MQISTLMSAVHLNRLNRIQSIKDSIKTNPIISKMSLHIKQKMSRQRKQSLNISNLQTSQIPQSPYNQNEQKLNVPLQNNSFQLKYTLKEQLGEGTNGRVYKCIHNVTLKMYAVKIQTIDEEHVLELKKNYLSLRDLSHTLIVKYRALYFDKQKETVYLVMQYLSYPDLIKSVIGSEQELKHIIQQLLKALKILHQNNICHRDIKPENILYCEQQKKIKLIDFGISKRTFQRGGRRDMLTMTGTPYYIAPEVYQGGGYDERVDLWALGITMYRLISGYTPFESQYHSDTILNIVRGELKFDQHIWNCYDGFAKDFVSRLLRPKLSRMTINQAEKHLWLQTVNQTISRKGKLYRSSTNNEEINKQFIMQQNLKMKKAQSKQQGQKGYVKLLYRNVNLISLKQYSLQDSENQDSIVVSPYIFDKQFTSFP